MNNYVTIGQASRITNIHPNTILALGRRGTVNCRDYWRSAGGRLVKGWRPGYRKQWHVDLNALKQLSRIQLAAYVAGGRTVEDFRQTVNTK